MSRSRYALIIAPTARRQLAERLPEAVAAAVYEFIIGPLLDNPHGVGRRLHPPLADRHSARRGTYRVIYRIDDEAHTVSVIDVGHRSDVFFTQLGRLREGQSGPEDVARGVLVGVGDMRPRCPAVPTVRTI